MALYALGDLHLALGAADKPMDVFGGKWTGYMEKLQENLSVLRQEDTLVIVGDFCWALGLSEAEADFRFLSQFPGRKLFVKGNHDYWWNTAAKFERFCREGGFADMHLLHNNCHFYGDIALCGTRGWFFEEEQGGSHDEKVFRRELIRLETSLKAAGEMEKYCFLHYPPRYRGYVCEEILALLKQYRVSLCCYGHLHGDSHKLAMEGLYDGTDFRLVAADFVNFQPVCLVP